MSSVEQEDLCVRHRLQWLLALNDGEKMSNSIRSHIIDYHCCSASCREFSSIFETLDCGEHISLANT